MSGFQFFSKNAQSQLLIFSMIICVIVSVFLTRLASVYMQLSHKSLVRYLWFTSIRTGRILYFITIKSIECQNCRCHRSSKRRYVDILGPRHESGRNIKWLEAAGSPERSTFKPRLYMINIYNSRRSHYRSCSSKSSVLARRTYKHEGGSRL